MSHLYIVLCTRSQAPTPLVASVVDLLYIPQHLDTATIVAQTPLMHPSCTTISQQTNPQQFGRNSVQFCWWLTRCVLDATYRVATDDIRSEICVCVCWAQLYTVQKRLTWSRCSYSCGRKEPCIRWVKNCKKNLKGICTGLMQYTSEWLFALVCRWALYAWQPLRPSARGGQMHSPPREW